jgi:hypothetical protein
MSFLSNYSSLVFIAVIEKSAGPMRRYRSEHPLAQKRPGLPRRGLSFGHPSIRRCPQRRITPAAEIGSVTAPDAETAIRKAIEEFPKLQRLRLVARRIA